MNNTLPVAADHEPGVVATVQRIIAVLDSIPYWFIALAARIFPAAVFWQSGQTKVAAVAPQAERDRAVPTRISAAAGRSNDCRLPVGFWRTSFPDLARPWAGDAFCRHGPFVHDRGDRNLRLSGCLADPRSLGHLLSRGDRARPRRAVARPFDCAQRQRDIGCARLGAAPAKTRRLLTRRKSILASW